MTRYRQDELLAGLPRNGKTIQLAKLPPQTPALEEAVIGAILVDKKAVHEVIPILEPSDFYVPANQSIYQTALELFADGKPIDTLTVITALRKKGDKSEKWQEYIPGLTNKIASASNVEEHALIIREKAVKREVIAIGQEIERLAYSEESDALELLQDMQARLLQISTRNAKNKARSIQEIVREFFRNLELKSKQPEGKALSGLPTGLVDLDRILGGMEGGDLIIIAGRPGMGKTSLALGIFKTIVLERNKPAAFFSLEVKDTKLIAALVSMMTGIDNDRIKKGRIADHEWHPLNNAQTTLEKAPLLIDDTASVSYIDLRSRCLSLKTTHPDLALIVVDYLQLMSGVKKGDKRMDEISVISRNLKLIAKEIDVPLIALSQLSRDVEKRGGSKRPILSDLRESGSIEQDADKVLFVFRPEYYGMMEDEEGRPTAGVAEVIVSKNRDGDTDTAVVRFIGKTTTFRDLTYSESIDPNQPPY